MMKSDLGPKSGRKRMGRDQPENSCEFLLHVPQVVPLLLLEPEAGCRAREAGEADGHVRAERRLAGEDAMEGLAGDAKLAGRLADGEAEAGQNPVAQDPSRVGRSHRKSVS